MEFLQTLFCFIFSTLLQSEIYLAFGADKLQISPIQMTTLKATNTSISIELLVNDDNITVNLNDTTTFSCDTEHFIKNYIWYNPLRNSVKLIEYITKNAVDAHEKNVHLVLIWHIDAINEQIIVKIPLEHFELNLDKCDEKEQLEYYKQQYIKLQQLIKINNLIIDQIVITKFSDDCIFRIYSLDEVAEYYLAEMPQKSDSFDESKSRVYQSIISSLNNHYFKSYNSLDKTLQKSVFPGSICKNGRCLTQIKPFEMQIDIYKTHAKIHPVVLLFNIDFAEVIEHQTFANFFTKDIILRSDLQFTKNTYSSKPIQVNFEVSDNYQNKNNQGRTDSWSQLSRFTVFYRMVYTKQTLYLKYILGGYVKNEPVVKSSNPVYFNDPNFALLVTQSKLNSAHQTELAHVPAVTDVYSVTYRRNYYSAYEQLNNNRYSTKQIHKQSYLIKCFLNLGNIEMTL